MPLVWQTMHHAFASHFGGVVEQRALAAPKVREGRTITGMSAVLLPYSASGEVDWTALEASIERTVAAGITPAVNMDTGYVQLLDEPTRIRVLDIASATGAFVAGAFVDDTPGDAFDRAGYLNQMQLISERGGTPVVFPSHGLNEQPEPELIAALAGLGDEVDKFIAFELGPMFVPYGRIYSMDAYEELLGIDACIGAKHSSLEREPEWQRLALRDLRRPDFLILTGNDLAIDMVMYGSDYLLGLSTFAPDLFAERDRLWASGDRGFFELNDLLQYLGFFAFRAPVPAYRHCAAIFHELRGWASSDWTPPGVPRRPDADRAVLADIAERLGVLA